MRVKVGAAISDPLPVHAPAFGPSATLHATAEPRQAVRLRTDRSYPAPGLAEQWAVSWVEKQAAPENHPDRRDNSEPAELWHTEVSRRRRLTSVAVRAASSQLFVAVVQPRLGERVPTEAVLTGEQARPALGVDR